MAQINLKQLEAFVQVADHQSFRLAAEVLATTQPNISSRISALEQLLGVKLMDRSSGHINLTPVGERLLEQARLVLRQMDEFIVVAGEDRLFEGVLRLGVTEMIVHSWLSRYLTALKKRFPNIDVELLVDFSHNLSGAPFNRSVDLVFQSEPFNQQSSGSTDLGSYSLVWVAAPALVRSNGSVTLDELMQHSILTHARGTLPFEQITAHIAEHASTKPRLVPSTNLAACLQMTIDGLGVACLPEVMISAALKAKQLQQISYPWVPQPLQFRARFDADTVPHYVSEAAILAAEIALA